MIWRDRGFPLIGKGKPDRHLTCSLGPAAYTVKHGNFGTGCSKCTMGRPQEIMHGPPDVRVQPVDTHGMYL